MIPEWANNYIGIPFSEKNCWGLFRLIFEEQRGIVLPSYDEEYEDSKDGEKIEKLIIDHKDDNCWQEIPVGQEELFDAVVIRAHYRLGRNKKGKLLYLPADMHIAMILERYVFIHSESNDICSCIGYYDRQPYSNRVISFHRYVGE